ncbi:MAG: translation initiation factor IF-2 [Pseudomonadota bacterium]
MGDETNIGKLSLNRPGNQFGRGGEQNQVRQSMSHGRHRMVQVEIKRSKRNQRKPAADAGANEAIAAEAQASAPPPASPELQDPPSPQTPQNLSQSEQKKRLQALETAAQQNLEQKRQQEAAEHQRLEQEQRKLHSANEERQRAIEAMEQKRDNRRAERGQAKAAQPNAKQVELAEQTPATTKDSPSPAPRSSRGKYGDEEREGRSSKPSGMRGRDNDQRRTGRLSIARALEEEEGITRMRSLAALKRARTKERKKNVSQLSGEKIIRDVVVPETISVVDLANRMAERARNVIKTLMELGVAATQNQIIDADTAELVIQEMGHRIRRVAESDVEIALDELEHEQAERMENRAPVVTVMGHVDHGKTSLLDALRESHVVNSEAGGITQHIGAWRIQFKTGDITFIDTPGHEAFSAMRSRGARITDIVVLMVAADDGVQPQTIEAINHARAAEVPIIVAINKCDRPDVDPNRVRNELMRHDILTEAMGGEILDVEISALKRTNLDKLVEAILLQAELLDLQADPHIAASGVVLEARIEVGRGVVTTLLPQKGTLRTGDSLVSGSEWGRVRAMMDANGSKLKQAGPSMPVEITGLQGLPEAGELFTVLASESKAREIAEYRQRKRQEMRIAKAKPGTLDQMFEQIRSHKASELTLIVKADVQGSLEALLASLTQLSTDALSVTIMHNSVGSINESDIRLAATAGAIILGFNVRANPQARDLARKLAVDIRYFSVIYEMIDDMRDLIAGIIQPESRDVFLGYADIRQVFAITKVGKIAGCMVTEGTMKRGAGIRVLRDDVVIYNGSLKQLKRFKNDTREVQQGYECGMAFENFNDIREGDRVECFENRPAG